MKPTNWIVMLLLTAALASAGCGKPKGGPPTVGQVTVDTPRLQEAFAKASPELQAIVGDVFRDFRYGEYPAALASLDKLSQAPGLTESQKKVVTEVTEQMKQAAAGSSSRPAQ